MKVRIGTINCFYCCVWKCQHNSDASNVSVVGDASNASNVSDFNNISVASAPSDASVASVNSDAGNVSGITDAWGRGQHHEKCTNTIYLADRGEY